MKIGPIDTKAISPAGADRKNLPAPVVAKAEPSAQVALSPEASLLSQLSSDPTFDAKKVERIAQAIRDGQFRVNPEAIADKLIANAQELMARKPGVN